MAKSSGSIWVSLGLSTQNFSKGVSRARKDLTGFQKFTSGLKNMFNPFTIGIGAIAGVGAAISSAVGIFKDFEKANSGLAAVLGKNTNEIRGLSDQAKQLGATTAFTASQVTELQTELAKLGFAEKDIKNMAASTLDAAAALGSELGEQAAVTGATLKSFGLDSKDAAMVNDVLAKSASSSALDFQKLSVALPIVGATAKTAGVSLQQTASLLGTLSNNGLDASTSATSLRNIFLELSKQGITWEQAMAKINASTDKNATAMDLFGKRGATAGIILAESGVKIDELTTTLNNAEGAAKEMADTMLNNLSGDMTKAQSAYEGFVLSLEDGSGAMSNALRGVVKGFTDTLTTVTDLNKSENLTWFEQLAGVANTAAGEMLLLKNALIGVKKASNFDELKKNSVDAVKRLQEAFNEGKISREQFISSVKAISANAKKVGPAMAVAAQKTKEHTSAVIDDNAAITAGRTSSSTAATERISNIDKINTKHAETKTVLDALQSKTFELKNAQSAQAAASTEAATKNVNSMLMMSEGFKQILQEKEMAQKQLDLDNLAMKTQAYASASNEAFASMANTAVASMGQAESGLQQFQQATVGIILKVMGQALSAALANAIAGASGAAAVAGPFAPAVLPATIASMTGSIFAAFAAIPAFADGGIVSGPTLGLMGEYAGASSNPEVIAPLDKLRNMIGGEAGGGEYTFRLEGSTLVAAINRHNKSQSYSR